MGASLGSAAGVDSAVDSAEVGLVAMMNPRMNDEG
jgi:hypothetical protein